MFTTEEDLVVVDGELDYVVYYSGTECWGRWFESWLLWMFLVMFRTFGCHLIYYVYFRSVFVFCKNSRPVMNKLDQFIIRYILNFVVCAGHIQLSTFQNMNRGPKHEIGRSDWLDRLPNLSLIKQRSSRGWKSRAFETIQTKACWGNVWSITILYWK